MNTRIFRVNACSTPVFDKQSKQLEFLWKTTDDDKSSLNLPEGVAFLPSRQLVVADTGNHRLQIFSLSGTLIRTISQNKLTRVLGDWLFKPHCVAAVGEGDILVTDGQDKAVKCFNQHGQSLYSFRKDKYTRAYFSPYGVACCQNQYTVLSHCDKYITVHEPDGCLVVEIQEEGAFWYLDTDHFGRIIVSDCYNHCIKIFDVNGTLIRSFGSRGHADGCMQYPHGICVDQAANIIVADSLNSRITQFSPDGRFMQHILVEKDGVRWPRGVATDPNGHIVVTWNNNLTMWKYSSIFSMKNFLMTHL